MRWLFALLLFFAHPDGAAPFDVATAAADGRCADAPRADAAPEEASGCPDACGGDGHCPCCPPRLGSPEDAPPAPAAPHVRPALHASAPVLAAPDRAGEQVFHPPKA